MNQCDGCKAGIPMAEDGWRHDGGDYNSTFGCDAYKYYVWSKPTVMSTSHAFKPRHAVSICKGMVRKLQAVQLGFFEPPPEVPGLEFYPGATCPLCLVLIRQSARIK